MGLMALSIVWGGYLLALYLVIFWLLVLFRERSRTGQQAPDERENSLQSPPLVTVAIPAWNEAAEHSTDYGVGPRLGLSSRPAGAHRRE